MNLYNKYVVSKTNREPIDKNAQYFVLRVDTDNCAKKALLVYADEIEKSGDIDFAQQIRNMIGDINACI